MLDRYLAKWCRSSTANYGGTTWDGILSLANATSYSDLVCCLVWSSRVAPQRTQIDFSVRVWRATRERKGQSQTRSGVCMRV